MTILDPWKAVPGFALGKPRARWSPAGTGYWVVRLVRNGTVYQGVGATLTEAYGAWVSLMEQHR